MQKTKYVNRQWVHRQDLPSLDSSTQPGRKRTIRMNSLIRALKKIEKNFEFGAHKNRLHFTYPYPQAISNYHILVNCEVDHYQVRIMQRGYGVIINCLEFITHDMTGRELLANLADRNILDHTWVPTAVPVRLPYKD